MTKTKKIWITLIVLWLLIWAVFAVEMSSEQGLTVSRVIYMLAAPILIVLGIWWVRRP